MMFVCYNRQRIEVFRSEAPRDDRLAAALAFYVVGVRINVIDARMAKPDAQSDKAGVGWHHGISYLIEIDIAESRQ
jgi:hypothetical protein